MLQNIIIRLSSMLQNIIEHVKEYTPQSTWRDA